METGRIAHVTTKSSKGYALGVRAGRHQLTADEPMSNGGTDVDLQISREGETEHIERRVRFSAPLSDQQRALLAEIAERTPVTRTLKRGVAIETLLVI